MRTGLLALAVLVLATVDAQAAFVARFDFSQPPPDGQPGNQGSTSAVALVPGIESAVISRGAGLTPIPSAHSINAGAWSENPTINADDYFVFTITAESGYTVNLTGIDFGHRRTGSGPTDFVVQTIANGVTQQVGTYFTDSASNLNKTILFPSGFSFTGTLEVRIYGYNATNSAGMYQIRNTSAGYGENGEGDGGESGDGVFVNGSVEPTVNAVPAPASAILLGLGAPALLLVRRRRGAK